MVNGLENGFHPDLLDPEQDRLFLQELARIEKERSGSDRLSTMYADSDENQFIERVLFWIMCRDLDVLHFLFPEYMKEALQQTPETLTAAASEWERFSTTYYRELGRPVPDWPMYEEIQKGLGVLGTSMYHRHQRTLKRKLQGQLKRILDNLAEQFPGWGWLAGERCYLAAALSDKYILPSGKYSCTT
jgi:hypothetical protein